MRRVSLLASLSLLCAVLPASTALAADCPGSDLRPAQGNVAEVGEATLCLLNAERTSRDLAPLSEQHQLTAASVDFSALMVKQHFFAHVAPDGRKLTDRLEVTGYLARPGGWTVGENIAWGESYLATPASIVQAWMDSPPHRENILSPEFEEIGMGIVVGVPFSDNAGATYTTDFGTRTPASDKAEDEDVQVEPAAGSGAESAQVPGRPSARKRSARRSSSARSRDANRARRAHRRVIRRSNVVRRAYSMRAIQAGIAG